MDIRKNKINKIIYKIMGGGVRLSKLLSESMYMKLKCRLLRMYGMNISLDVGYIDPSAYFDNYDYSLITIGSHCTISREVLFLTHDFSISKGLYAIGIERGGRFMGKIEVGENSFIGARVTLLPGTYIGKNCVIGAGSVVKGRIEDNSIVVGNPARKIGATDEWGRKHYNKQDYIPNP